MWIRVATMADVPALRSLIATSVRELGGAYYSPAQIEAAITAVFGVDSQLISDGTSYLIDSPSGPVAIGGWSYRGTLYGGDQMKSADDPRLDRRTEPARIRAFFVRPSHARRGLAKRLYHECAIAARVAGFRRFELVATLPGEPLYTAVGFLPVERISIPVAPGVELSLIRMSRDIDAGDA